MRSNSGWRWQGCKQQSQQAHVRDRHSTLVTEAIGAQAHWPVAAAVLSVSLAHYAITAATPSAARQGGQDRAHARPQACSELKPRSRSDSIASSLVHAPSQTLHTLHKTHFRANSLPSAASIATIDRDRARSTSARGSKPALHLQAQAASTEIDRESLPSVLQLMESSWNDHILYS